MDAAARGVVRIDHGVVPTNDLGESLAFLTDVLGARFNRLVNVNLRGLSHEVPEMAFVTLANHGGFGIALQHQPIPAPVRALEGPVWGLEVSAKGLDGVCDVLRATGVPVDDPVAYSPPSPIAASLFLHDPFQCVYELSVRRDAASTHDHHGQGHLGLRRISHVRVEVSDLAVADSWYRETLGLIPAPAVPGPAQQTYAVPVSGQLFILHEVPALTARSHYSRGPHIDVKVPVGTYHDFVERLTNVERYWGPFGDQIPWHEPDRQTVYFYDPFGNRFQVGELHPHPAHGSAPVAAHAGAH